MPYASKALLSLDVSLSCVLPPLVGCRSISCGLGLDLHTYAYIKGFWSFSLCMHMSSCLFLCFVPMLASLDLGFAMLCVSPKACLCGCIHPSLGLIRCSHLWDTPPWCWCAWFMPFSTLCDVYMLAFLAWCHHVWLSLLLLHLCTLTYMFMHESMCHPYSNPMEL